MIPYQPNLRSCRAGEETDVPILWREAETAAAQLVRSLRLPNHHQDDLRQDLLVDLLRRLKKFDPERGTLGAFAGKIVRHRASGLAARIRREHRHFVALEEMPAEVLVRPEWAWEPFPDVERAMDRKRAQETLTAAERALWVALNERSPSQASLGGQAPSRASRNRRLRSLRLTLIMAGLPVDD